ncbi:X-Pro dipeptidyl-peptidase, S15 family [Leptospira ryugenii]|uniref:X-Pro dipeptidyl-peptidase, S15 family n=1 Tax=Leptospira ryugenii TaxID=1917863 RepID=A0A2P2E0R3_9LEPT|nr:prolyl oligopeptidase family serine peptidase [Leptospira ryugenii]GBF50463.1 X-Pro dipeptidyl-peptidase, S15 family [Leptospira ryugenii]
MQKLKYIWKTIHFLKDLQIQNSTLPSVEEIQIETSKQKLNADVYIPKGRSLGTIVTINGLAPLGNRDPRFIIVNKSLQNFGFTVVSPYYEDICNFYISKENISLIRESIEWISSREELTSSGKVSLFAPSFSGSLSLIVSSDKRMKPITNAICSIGAYGNVKTVIQNLFSNQDLDEYGRMILLLNFLPLSIGENQELYQAIRFALLDNYFKEHDKRLAPFLKNMSEENITLFNQLRSQAETRLYHWERILGNGGESKHLLSDLSVLEHLKEVSSPVLLVHGYKDDVVPASEADLMAEELKKHHSLWNVCKTNLISHGDTGFSLLSLIELPKLIRSFAFFFKYATN